MAEKHEVHWTFQDHAHNWQVWEKRDPKFVDMTTNTAEALTLIDQNMAKRYATCSCGTRLTVTT